MAADRLFDRRVKLTVFSTTQPTSVERFNVELEQDNGFVIEDLRVEFDIEHSAKKHPNQCSIKITNLNEESRTAFKKTPLRVTLEAGYVGGLATIFTGDVTYAISTLDGPNWVTELQLGDGDRVYANARVNRSYSAKVSTNTMLKDALGSVGQFLPDNIKNHPAFNKVIEGGMALSGRLPDVLTDLIKPLGYTMAIQDNQITITHEEETVGGTYIISEDNGMLGSPEFGKPSRKNKAPDVTIRSLLYPEIRPNHPVQIISRDLNGIFKVKKVKHTGDTHGDNWFTEVEIKPISK